DLQSVGTEELKTNIGSIFMKEPSVKRNDNVYYVNCNNGVKGSKDNANMLRIWRVDWYISGDIREGNCSLHFADVFVSFSPSLECFVHCAHSPERHFKICQDLKIQNLPGEGVLVRNFNSRKRFYIDHPVVEAAKPSGDVSYLIGTSDLGNKLFIKRVPVAVDCSKIFKVYSDCDHIANVVSLRSYEQDDQFVYMAFEETNGTLIDYMGILLLNMSKLFPKFKPLVDYLRNVVHALMQLHKNDIIHGDVAPQHVLVRRGPGNDGMIKLCGMGKSTRIRKSDKESITTSAYKAQNYQLARTILNILGGHEFDGTQGQEFINDDLKKVGNLAAHLCMKLMDPNSSISLLEVYNHILFWDANKKINFIGEVSNALSSNELSGIEHLASDVFGVDVFGFKGWKGKVDSNWLSVMETASKHDRSLKVDAYDEDSLFDLVKLFRNSIQHPKRIYPAQNYITLERYISMTFPNLMTLLYNHMLDCSKKSTLYKKYHKEVV
ncbi:serine/threonine-protein kinase/endoribonuclease IRE1b-like protein, partial [Tanacetum coccineum]